MSWPRTLLCVASCLCVGTVLSGATPDRLLFARLGPAHGELFVSNADGTGEHALTPPGSLDYNPTWASTGDWIVFTSERDGSADLYRVHADGTGLERLTDSPAFDDQAAASPDGRHIAFVTTRAAGFANLAILDVATHAVTPLTSGTGGDFRPAWSPDGQWIAFSSDRASDLPSAANRWERLHVTAIYVIRPDGTGRPTSIRTCGTSISSSGARRRSTSRSSDARSRHAATSAPLSPNRSASRQP